MNGLGTLNRQDRLQREKPKKGRFHYAAPGVPLSSLPEQTEEEEASAAEAGSPGAEVEKELGEQSGAGHATDAVAGGGGEESKRASSGAGDSSPSPTVGYLTGTEAAWKVLNEEKRWMTRSNAPFAPSSTPFLTQHTYSDL
jgi:hypothetical protein